MPDDRLPPPPVPFDCDLRDLQWMPLDVVRLRDSELAATPDAEVFRVSVLSWCVSWHQIPAASLPDDDASLARLLGFGRDVATWKQIRAAGGLRGWVKHSDGRLYHQVVAEKAVEASGQKQRAKAKREKDADRLHRWRLKHGETADETGGETGGTTHDETRFATRDETRFVATTSQRDQTGPDRTLPDLTLPYKNTAPPPPVSVQPGNEGTATATAAHVRTNVPKRIPTGPDPHLVASAVQSGDLHALISLWGAGSPVEWARDFPGVSLAQIATLLAWKTAKRAPIRHASGGRAARDEFAALDAQERREWASYAVTRYNLPIAQAGGAA
jgi:hypothetical protein